MERPSYMVTMSPGLRPARLAGELGVTEETSAPLVSGRLKVLARSGVSGWMATPGRPALTLPRSPSGGTTDFASLPGRPKRRPPNAQPWLKLGGLMRTTGPRAWISGPLLL